MKTLEKTDGNWFDQLMNKWPWCRDTDDISTVAIAWLFKEDGKWSVLPRFCGKQSLFYNAIFFIRLTTWGLFWSVRWSEATDKRALLQASFGWKLNGRFTATPLLFAFRIQSDASSAAGVSGPNTGQATGFNFGTH